MANNISAIEINKEANTYQKQSETMTLKSSDNILKNIIFPNEFDKEVPTSCELENDISSNSTLSDLQYNNYSGQSPKLDITHDDIINAPILQKEGKTIFVLITFPTRTIIKNIKGITNDLSESNIQYQVASAYGITTGSTFNDQTKFLPGDYCIGLVFDSNEEANKVVSIKLNVILEPISNLMLSQIIFGLYRSLGFEPSHVLKYPIRSVSSGIPFYRKTRGEIGKVIDTISQLSTNITEQNVKISAKIDELPIHKISEISSMVSNTSSLINGLDSRITDTLGSANEINSKFNNQILNLEKRVDNVDNLNAQISELIGKIDKISEIVNPLSNVQEKLKEISKGISSEPVLRQFEEIQNQISQLHEQLDNVMDRNSNSNDDIEKGVHEIQNITVSDFEKLIKERTTYFDKLIEAEEYIDYLQEEIEESEKSHQQALNSKSHRTNFIRRNAK